MDYIFYIFLGFLQGVFEWLPISSTSIVALVANTQELDFNPIDIAFFLHSGTLLATFVYFWRDIKNLILFKDKKLVKFFIIVSVISGTFGYLAYKSTSELAIGSTLLIIIGLGLLLTSFFQSKKIRFNMGENLSAVVVGVLQALTAIPGVSRSGATIFGLSLTETDPEKILRYSYLISIPVVLGADIYLKRENLITLTPEIMIAVLSSFIFGLLTLKVLLTFSHKVNFSKFTLFFGVFCIISAIISMMQ